MLRIECHGSHHDPARTDAPRSLLPPAAAEGARHCGGTPHDHSLHRWLSKACGQDGGALARKCCGGAHRGAHRGGHGGAHGGGTAEGQAGLAQGMSGTVEGSITGAGTPTSGRTLRVLFVNAQGRPLSASPAGMLEQVQQGYNAAGVNVDLQTVGQLSVPASQMPELSSGSSLRAAGQKVEQLRRQAGADIVVFTSARSPNGNITGTALIDGAAAVVKDISHLKTLGHEIGHTLGLHHEDGRVLDGRKTMMNQGDSRGAILLSASEAAELAQGILGKMAERHTA